MKLIIPGRLDGLNAYIAACRANQYKGAKLKADNEKMVILAIRRQLRGVKFEKQVYMTYHWFEANKRRDLDNISSFGRKVIQDALVKTEVLRNDGWREIKGFRDEFHVDPERPRIEVDILEVET